jgi:acyl-coenzyme A synthetase/AMP-(fatty) acid ligase
MPRSERLSLWDLTAASSLSPQRFIADSITSFRLNEFAHAHNLSASPETFRGRSVLLSSHHQLPAALALLQLDGIARRVLLCTPDLAPEYVPAVINEAEIDVIVTDGTGPAAGYDVTEVVTIRNDLTQASPPAQRDQETEWLLFTSGTTGRPKIVVHTLASLTGPLDDGLNVQSDAVWSTFYDIRRYGGLQILLRALLGGASMVLSQANETVADFLTRAQRCGVTHMSGTPSHWRCVLMTPAAGAFAPAYIRLSGEVADQAVLNNLAATFPTSDIAHAFASTEAGVAFDVRDGLAGFPATLIRQSNGKAEIRVVNGSMRIRSDRVASRYLGSGNRLGDTDGFVDTGDLVDLRGDRYYFIGRREGVINVGGRKVHPEEVEAVINRHPGVQMSRVRARPNPITGAIVVADIVLKPGTKPMLILREEILDMCRTLLPPHKVPAMLTQVAGLEIAGSGKLARTYA